MVGTFAGEVDTGEFPSILSRIERGEVFSEKIYSKVNDGLMYKSFAPVDILENGHPWIFSMVVPEKEILANLYKLTLKIIIVFILGLALISGITYYSINLIVKVINAIMRKVDDIARYDFGSLQDIHLERYEKQENELGQIIRSLKTMVANIVSLIEDIKVSSEEVLASAESLNSASSQSSIMAEELEKKISIFKV